MKRDALIFGLLFVGMVLLLTGPVLLAALMLGTSAVLVWRVEREERRVRQGLQDIEDYANGDNR